MNEPDWHGWSHDQNDTYYAIQAARLMPPNTLIKYTHPDALWIVDEDVVWVGFETANHDIGLVVYRVD